MLQKPHMKHTHTHQKHTPKTHTQSPRCGENTMKTTTTTRNTSTPMGMINGHSPHPPTCMWVGWVFCLGLGVGVDHFIFTFIIIHVIMIQ